MNIWALRRRQMWRRYGKWLAVFISIGLTGAYFYSPHADVWKSVGAGLSRIGGSVSAGNGGPVQGTHTRASYFAVGSFKVGERSVGGYAEGDVRCLSLAVFYDAAGGPLDVKKAIAQIVMNRAQARKDSKSLCKVVYFGLGLPHGCMFKETCRKVGASTPEESPGWLQAMEVAKGAIDGATLVPKLAEATHFHAITDVRPEWSRQLFKVAVLGRFIFYSNQPVDDEVDRNTGGAVVGAEPSAPRPMRPRPSAPAAATSSSKGAASDVFNRTY